MWRWLERVLWGSAIIALGIYAGTTGERRISQVYLNWKFEQEAALPARLVPANASIPDSAQPLGRIEIPSIGLSAIFIEGADNRTLRRGIGHIPGTVLPGNSGNAGLSAHRDTFFRRLSEVRKGDVISITTMQGPYKYIVESYQAVDPDEAIVLHDIGRPTLTLVTCYPFYYVGSAPKRFVVHASLAL